MLLLLPPSYNTFSETSFKFVPSKSFFFVFRYKRSSSSSSTPHHCCLHAKEAAAKRAAQSTIKWHTLFMLILKGNTYLAQQGLWVLWSGWIQTCDRVNESQRRYNCVFEAHDQVIKLILGVEKSFFYWQREKKLVEGKSIFGCCGLTKDVGLNRVRLSFLWLNQC